MLIVLTNPPTPWGTVHESLLPLPFLSPPRLSQKPRSSLIFGGGVHARPAAQELLKSSNGRKIVRIAGSVAGMTLQRDLL